MQVTHHYQRLPSLSATLHVVPSSVPLSGKKARRALGLVPSRIGRLSSTSLFVHEDDDDDGIFSLFSLALSLSLSHPPFVLDPLTLSLAPVAESFCSSGYAARFISYPTNWEARTAARIPERRFPPLRGMRYREGRRDRTEFPTSEPESPPRRHLLRSSASPAFFNYGATLYPPYVPARSINGD